MKFEDILARELTEWPVPEYEYVVHECDGELYFYQRREDAKFSGRNVWICGEHGSRYTSPTIFVTLADDWKKSIVSQSEWQSARAAYLASIQPARDPEIAAVVDKPTNPWRRNRGRKTPPVPVGTRVDVKYRDGQKNYGARAGYDSDSECSHSWRVAFSWSLTGEGGDIMQWRYAELQQEMTMAQTIEQVVENAEAAVAKAFDPIALRDEFKRITSERQELSQMIGKLTDRMGEIEAALRAEGFALVEPEKHNAD